MGVPYAEVIGDPIAHSKSPLIHQFWLRKLGLQGNYRATYVHRDDLGRHIAARRNDPDWRGCSVSLPHKIHVIEHLEAFTPEAVAIGAVNCVYRDGDRLIGTNTDADGIGEVFDSRLWRANQVTLIGGGGAARAALEVLRRRDTLEVFMVVRDPDALRPVHAAFARSGGVHSFEDLRVPLGGSEYVINASSLGMEGMEEMPESVLRGLERVAKYAIVFDLVYNPPETALLKKARELSLDTATGLEMLVGQARSAFQHFYGQAPPREFDAELHGLLTS
jgi:shikimate dehydrogenase